MSNKKRLPPPAWTYKASGASRSARIRGEYDANPKICPNCGQKLAFEKKYNTFCNSSCAASFNNQGLVRNQRRHNKECANCGEVKETLANKYCKKCIDERVYTQRPLSFYSTDRHRKFYLLRRRGHNCQNCGLSEWMGNPIALELDHIDGNPDNNTEENLRLLCPNCHAQTETYKGKGIASGKDSKRKTMRRNRYRNGQSY